MIDIMVTLSKNDKIYAGNIIEERNWAKGSGPLWYPLSKTPKDTRTGCAVYFILNGQMVGRAKIEYIGDGNWKGVTHKGRTLKHTGCAIEYSNIKFPRTPVKCSGFRNFRYVREPLLNKFESAFKKK